MAVKPLINRIARTGLSFAGSTRLFATARFSKFAVAGLHKLSDSLSHHLRPSLSFPGNIESSGLTLAVTGRGERMRATGPVQRVVRQRVNPR